MMKWKHFNNEDEARAYAATKRRGPWMQVTVTRGRKGWMVYWS